MVALDDSSLLAQRTNEKIGNELSSLKKNFYAKYKSGYSRSDVKFANVSNKELMILNYTSGTTGFSKGVMITGNNIAGNVVFGIKQHLHYKGSKCLSFLPLAHAYGCAFDLLTPLAVGTHITLLGRIPSPKIMLKALAEVKPNLIICVPLILEKIYRKQIVPKISNAIRRLYSAVMTMLTEWPGPLNGCDPTEASYLAKGFEYMTSPSGKYAMSLA